MGASVSQRDIFSDKHKFQDDVWGEIRLNNLERDVIDTPEFQRLFRTSQLGFVNLFYQTANHTRGAHSIGACHIAQRLIKRLAKNTVLDGTHDRYATIHISRAEKVLIRLGALLHDITHVPFSHDIERKNHHMIDGQGTRLKIPSYYGKYEKHDDYESNPLLHLLVFNTDKSILARVLKTYSKPFCELLYADAVKKVDHPHLEEFVSLVKSIKGTKWKAEESLLPELLFHLLFFEKQEEADKPTAHEQEVLTQYDASSKDAWGLGPAQMRRALHISWYQPFRHDIIGNTLSADLIDYLKRDLHRLGMAREIDLHLLNYYVLVNPSAKDFVEPEAQMEKGLTTVADQSPARYRCAIEIQDHRRGTSRVVLINDIFRLLDLRHEIHEKAVMHRVVQSANAMLSRALLLMGDEIPNPQDLVKFGDKFHALQGEELFLSTLAEMTGGQGLDQSDAAKRESHSIIAKLVDRRVYRPLLIIPGDRAAERFNIRGGQGESEHCLRTLGALLDSPYYSSFLLFVCTCIEEFLTGRFDTDVDLLREVRALADDQLRRTGAMRHVPSRVLIWTTPYKQLYKDPGLIVALKNKVDQIDKLARLNSREIPEESSLIELVKTSIAHADSKYANLWKIYVFISDGIYYTGILNKLLPRSAQQQNNAKALHIEKLKKCEALVVAALEAICDDWSSSCDNKCDANSRRRRLIGIMPDEAFTALVDLWVPKYRIIWTNNSARGLSEVEIEQYVHDFSLDGSCFEDKCRDVRYKFPNSARAVWAAAKMASRDLPEHQLVRFLESCGVSEIELSEAEFSLLVSQYQGDVAAQCRALMEGNGKVKLDRSKLKLLWPSVICAPESVHIGARSISDSERGTTIHEEHKEPIAVEAGEKENVNAPADNEMPLSAAAPGRSLELWSSEVFEIPSATELAKAGRGMFGKHALEKSRENFVTVLKEIWPTPNEANKSRARRLWESFIYETGKTAARKRKPADAAQGFVRSTDEWRKVLGTQEGI
jgi:HD superfamily phosphohydrolase